MNRRRFLLWSSASVTIISGGLYWSSPALQDPTGRYSTSTLAALNAITPLILPSLRNDPQATQAFVQVFIEGIKTLSASQQKAFDALFQLLIHPASKRFICGIWSDWEVASPETIERMLSRWRNSRWALLNQAYNGLVQLTAALYYGHPNQWALAHYSGPPAQVRAALGR